MDRTFKNKDDNREHCLDLDFLRLHFDNHYYLQINIDVAEAVLRKEFTDGWDHFVTYGRFEGRKYKLLPEQGIMLRKFPSFDIAWDALNSGDCEEALRIYQARLVDFGTNSASFGTLASFREGKCNIDYFYYKTLLNDICINYLQPLQPSIPLKQLHAELDKDHKKPYQLYELARRLLSHFCDSELAQRQAAIVAASLALQLVTRLAPLWQLPRRAFLGLMATTFTMDMRGELFLHCMALDFRSGSLTVHEEALLGLLLLDLDESNQAQGRFENVLANQPSHIGALLGMALVQIQKIQACPQGRRGWDTQGQCAKAEMLFADMLRENPQDSGILLADATFARLTGDWERTRARCRDVLNNHPECQLARWLDATSAQYQGQLQEAERAYTDLLTYGTDGERIMQLTWIRQWQGQFDDFLIYSSKAPGTLPPPVPVSLEVFQVCRHLLQAVLADHPFELIMTLRPAATEKNPYTIIRSLKEYCLQIEADSNGRLYLSLGNALGWTFVRQYYVGSVGPSNDSYTLTLRRLDKNNILVFLNDTLTSELPLFQEYWIPGDTLLLGDDPLGVKPLSFKLQAFRLHIQTYTSVDSFQSIHLYSSFYGEQFSRMITDSLFPSLMQPSNIPELQKKYHIEHHIYCTKSDVSFLDNHFSLLEKIGIPCHVNTDLLDAHACNPRQHLGDTVVYALEKAICEHALLVFAPPDHIFGQGLANIVHSIAPHEYVVCGHPRILYEEAQQHVSKLFSQPDIMLYGLDNRLLVQFAMEQYPHHITRTGLSRPEPWWNATSRGDGFIVRFKDPPPLAIFPSRDLINILTGHTYAPSFETIDHDMVDFALRCNRLKMITDSRYFFWMEYCSKTRNYPTQRNDYWSRGAQLNAATELRWRT